MPANRNALVRYKTIDQCLQNRFRKWTLDDLIEACSEALYEYEGIEKGLSKRTVQADIQMMRSDKLGYNAPIVVMDRKYYTYEDPDYSITNIPLSQQDLEKLTETVEFLKQFQGFSHFRELNGMVQKLEDRVYAQRLHQNPVIDFEKNEHLKGLEFLDVLYQAIIHKRPLLITYQSFTARKSNTFDFQPYLLKEFRNRWFLIGAKENVPHLLNLALDRIITIQASKVAYQAQPNFNAEAYFKHAIGVSVNPKLPPQEVLLFINHRQAPYVLTKPLHWSQEEIKRDHFGVTIKITVQHNFELEKLILGFGDNLKVIAPQKLKHSIQDRLSNAIDLYDTEISASGLKQVAQKLSKKGAGILKQVYTKRELRKISLLLGRYFDQQSPGPFALRALLQKIPDLWPLLHNKNLQRIIATINPKAFLTKAIYFNKTPQTNWYVTWHQDVPINVKKKKKVPGYTSWTAKEDTISVCPPDVINKNRFAIRIHLDEANATNGALKIIPGSHIKRLSDEEIKVITNHSLPTVCEVPAGGAHLLKPLLLHASEKSKSQKRRRVIHLEFASMELDGGLEWGERL